MPIQAGSQTLLVKVMRDQSNASSQDEQTIQDTHIEVVLGFLGAEGSAVTHQVHEANGNTSVNVKDKIVFLGCGHSFNGDGVVKHLAAWESLVDKLFDELDT